MSKTINSSPYFKPDKNVVVLGAGTMGRGIALACALCGYNTILYDQNEKVLAEAMESNKTYLLKKVKEKQLSRNAAEEVLSLLIAQPNSMELKGFFVIEAIVEDLTIKQALFTDLQLLNGKDALYASNTSSLSITKIARNLPFPELLVGLHFFNPVLKLPLVELVYSPLSEPEVLEDWRDFVLSIQKEVVICEDSPGFIVNRVARSFYTESLKLAEEDVTSIDNIDNLCRNLGFKMGPFQLMDTIGNDVNFAVTKNLYEAFYHEPRFRPSRLQEKKVLAGHLGVKTKKGFYDY